MLAFISFNYFVSLGNRETKESSDFGLLKIHEDSIEYDMRHKKFGKCVIFNHEFYQDNKNRPRAGSTADAASLYQTFSNIGFDVTMKNDLTSNKLLDYIASGMFKT